MGDNDPVPDAASLMSSLVVSQSITSLSLFHNSPRISSVCGYRTQLTPGQDEFRSALDESLIIAIVGDYDLTVQFDEARAILQGLSQDAEAEEASRFNASGVDGDVDGLSGQEGPANTNSSHSVSGSKPYTDISSRTDFSDTLSDQFELLDLPQDVDVLALDEDGKIAELKVMFPLLKDMDIKFCLRKADGDFTKACEELLSTQFLEENGLRPKGIDGAFREDDHIGHKKGKKISLRRHVDQGILWRWPGQRSALFCSHSLMFS